MKNSIMTIGLSGAHRTGKTTLAEHVSKRYGLKLVKTNTSDLFKRLGVQPTGHFTLMQKLEIQNLILDEAYVLWKEVGFGFITDRTPLDMAAYMLMDYTSEATSRESVAIAEYIDRCFEISNGIFSNITIVQPGIPLINEAFKGYMDSLYIQKLNCLIRGLSNDDRSNVTCFSLPPAMTSLEKRVSALGRVMAKSKAKSTDVIELNLIH